MPNLRRFAGLVGLMAIACASVAWAAAGRRQVSGLHNARYCEILELRGVPPTATVTVWNSIGLNRCPAAQWNAFNGPALAKERGDTLVVLNGPRHFLMDSASAVVGGRHSFHGLRMTKVATIAIHNAGQLVRTPYTDRVITRTNTWRWNAGRTVYELIAPGGDVYIMQSYAQIIDRTLRLGQLSSLRHMLTLPTGWRYRTRTLADPLVLSATGSATVIQDNLQDTYQLATATRRGRRAHHAVAIMGRTHTVTPPATPGTVEDHGTISAQPFGRGTVVLIGTLADGRLTASFRLTFRRGSVIGTTSMPFTISGQMIHFAGTSRLTAGTGAYRGISSGALNTRDTNTLDGQHGRLTLAGSVTY